MDQLERSRLIELARLRRFDPVIRLSQFLDTMGNLIGHGRPGLLVTGFWRSGTTWMQQYLAAALKAKTVFEPLSPVNVVRERMLVEEGILCPDLREAHIPGPTNSDFAFWEYLDRAFHCSQLSAFELTCRSGLSASFRDIVVMKDVRMQLNVQVAHARYGVPVVHMRRHPCAVVSSLLAAKNWTWSFERIHLCDILEPLRQIIGSDRRLTKIDFEEFDNNVVSRIAAYWSITELAVERSLSDQRWGVIVPYEKAVKSPELYLREICNVADLKPVCLPSPHFESWSTHEADRCTPYALRPEAWRNRVSTHDRERILDIVSEIFPACNYLTEHGRS